MIFQFIDGFFNTQSRAGVKNGKLFTKSTTITATTEAGENSKAWMLHSPSVRLGSVANGVSKATWYLKNASTTKYYKFHKINFGVGRVFKNGAGTGYVETLIPCVVQSVRCNLLYGKDMTVSWAGQGTEHLTNYHLGKTDILPDIIFEIGGQTGTALGTLTNHMVIQCSIAQGDSGEQYCFDVEELILPPGMAVALDFKVDSPENVICDVNTYASLYEIDAADIK